MGLGIWMAGPEVEAYGLRKRWFRKKTQPETLIPQQDRPACTKALYRLQTNAPQAL